MATALNASRNRIHLPTDIWCVFREHLLFSKRNGTAAQLVTCSKAFYDFFLPVIDYTSLEIHQGNANKVFWGISGFPESSVNGAHPLVSSVSHQRKIGLIKQCRYLHLRDRRAAEACIEAYEAAGAKENLFEKVTRLSIGGQLAWDLRSFSREPGSLAHRLKSILSPLHLCVHFHIPARAEFFRQWECAGDLQELGGLVHSSVNVNDLDDLWQREYVNAVTSAVESFDRAWTLDSLTTHNLTAECIPAVYSPIHRIFFATEAPKPESDVEHAHFCGHTQATEIVDCVSLLGPTEGSTFEFVGIGCPICRVEGGHQRTAKFVKKAVCEALGQPGLKEDVEPQVRFRGRAEVEGCICCGEK